MAGVFKGGIPTDADVRALFDRFGVPTEGSTIAYPDVVATIKTPFTSSRYRTVVSRWRKRLVKEHNVYLKAGQGVYTAMDPAMRIDHGAQHYRSAARHNRKCYVVVGTTDHTRLSPEMKAKATHLQHTSATALQAMRISSKRTMPQLPAAVAP